MNPRSTNDNACLDCGGTNAIIVIAIGSPPNDHRDQAYVYIKDSKCMYIHRTIYLIKVSVHLQCEYMNIVPLASF